MIDKDAFCEKITENEKAMYYLAFSVVKNDADAAEVLRESIYRAYQNLDTLKASNRLSRGFYELYITRRSSLSVKTLR